MLPARSILALAAIMVATPAGAQLSDAGFVPSMVPHTVRQAPVVNAGFVHWGGSNGSVARADFWFGRIGAAASLGTMHAAGETELHGSAAALFEIVPQGVGLLKPGLQMQAGYSAHGFDRDGSWSIPIALGILIHAPIPLPLVNRAHALVHPALSMRHVVAGKDDADGTSAGVSLRIIFDDRAGALTMWGVYGYVRLISDGGDRGPRWETAISRVLRKPAPRG